MALEPGARILWTPRLGNGVHEPLPVGPRAGPQRSRGGPYYGTLACWVGLENGHRVALVYHEMTRATHLAFEDELQPFTDGRNAPGARQMPWDEEA